VILINNFRRERDEPLTRPSVTLSPSDGERDGVRGHSEIISENWFKQSEDDDEDETETESRTHL
jgi:hypothetical protein